MMIGFWILLFLGFRLELQTLEPNCGKCDMNHSTERKKKDFTYVKQQFILDFLLEERGNGDKSMNMNHNQKKEALCDGKVLLAYIRNI
jgi:hypothetical protein